MRRDNPLTTLARHYEIRGVFQGVGYRYSVRAAALASGIAGWVRALSSGVIEVHAEGTQEQLQSFRSALQSDSNYAGGLKVVDERSVDSERCTSFEIRQ
jgi:acylphosphatase